ncbi:AGE family epimerase/isomerase [Haloparvum sp. PAK95]|uniref:AGE family epimerase/isomerase n=1 Tax=Haloparvum sp. PAK95 TaxID=3418962 RepID=UPI003D2F51BB
MAHDDPEALRERLFDVLSFYYPTCRDESVGGHVAQLDEETGAVYDPDSRHLVATCRFVSNFALGATLDGPGWCPSAARHGLEFLESAHRQSAGGGASDGAADTGGGYAWLLDGREVVDDRRSPYGHAFVLLAHARAAAAGVDGADPDRVATLLDDRFRDENGLLGPVQGPDWKPRESYRGQNPNMHACEAFLAAYEATDDAAYLDRSLAIARRMTVDLADAEGRIWEHYTADWEPDHDYNRDDPEHQFRPWGFQPGHHAEWAKLLAGLARHRDDDWLLARARELFDEALTGWDAERGGFYYTLDFDGEPVIADKYGWPVAEAIGAAAALFEHTDERQYHERYNQFWDYADSHLVAPGGNWYAKLTAENERVPADEGPAVEPGYHPIGACYEGLRAFE